MLREEFQTKNQYFKQFEGNFEAIMTKFNRNEAKSEKPLNNLSQDNIALENIQPSEKLHPIEESK